MRSCYISLLFIYISCSSEALPNLGVNLKPTVLVHGGAGKIADELVEDVREGVKLAARRGYTTLTNKHSVLDAVQEAVRSMEANPNFNSGYGSVLTWEGRVEMDAAIMDGKNLEGGCVSVVRNIIHPIMVARRVMEKTRHRYLAGDGVMEFARDEGFEILPEGSLVTAKSLEALEAYKNSLNEPTFLWCNDCYESKSFSSSLFGSPGTVGAVAIDEFGNMAAATSTGGITGKLPGRIGDSPILGGGTYADNALGALSATGHGETIMRYNLASRILHTIKHEGASAQEATMKVLDEMTERFNQTAGVISIDPEGYLGIYFTSQQMSWAYQRGDQLHFGIEKDEDNVQIVGEPRTDTAALIT